MGADPEDRRVLLDRLRAQRDTLLENIAEATKILGDPERQIAELEGYVISRERI